MMGLSAVILTNKENKEIRPVLNSLSFADELIVVRDHSEDRLLRGNFAAQRNYGLAKSKNDWVLFVDDDEIVTSRLAREISDAIAPSDYQGFCLRRLDCYYGQILNHGETGSLRLLRLARKNAGHWLRPVHEVWQIKGRVGQLNNALIHDRKDLTASFIRRIIFYGPLDAKALTKEGKPFSYWRLILNPLGKFFLNYKLKLGFLDGYLGLFHAYLMSVQSLSVRVFQWQGKF